MFNLIKSQLENNLVLLAKFLLGMTLIMSTFVVIDKLMFNYVNSKIIAIQTAGIVLIVTALLLWNYKKILAYLKISKIYMSLLLLAITSGIATLFGLDPVLSLFSHTERGTGYILLLIIIGISLSMITFIKNKDDIRKFIFIPAAISGGILGFFTWLGVSGLNIASWSVLGVYSAGGGTMGNSSFAGTVFIFSLFIALYLLITEKKKVLKIIFGIAILFILINPVIISFGFFRPISGTLLGFIGDARGGAISLFIGLIISVIVLGFFSKKQYIVRLSKIMVALSIFVSLFSLISLFSKTGIVHNYVAKNSGEARFIYWDMAMKQFESYPILGTGPETFRYAHERFFDSRLIEIGELWADKPHNTYIEQLLTTGMVGFTAYVLLFVALGSSLYKYGKKSGDKYFTAIMSGLLVAYGVNNILLFDTATSLLWFYVTCGVIAWYTEIQGRTFSDKSLVYETKKTFIADRVFSGIIIVVLVVSGIFFITNEYKKLVLIYQEYTSKPPVRMNFYKKAMDASPYGAGISFAQRADQYASEYMKKIVVDHQVDVNAIADIEELSNVLNENMSQYKSNMQAYLANADLATAYMVITGKVDELWLNRLKFSFDKLNEISSKNPFLEGIKKNIGYFESLNTKK